jgi:glutathione S-transferase
MNKELTLVLGNRNYSSWSMRAWLGLRLTGLPFKEEHITLFESDAHEKVRAFGGETGLVPLLVDGQCAIWETDAIFEYLYEKCPSVWPSNSALRARARSICSEISSGFSSLKGEMPVNIRVQKPLSAISAGTQLDIERVCQIWQTYSKAYSSPWLFGEFCAADIYFAPIALRFQSYGVQLEGRALLYQQAILAHPLVKEWIELSRQDNSVIENFDSV